MKFLFILMIVPALSFAQADTNSDINIFSSPVYKPVDTVPCLFLSVIDTGDTYTKWSSGFIVRNNGMVSFSVFRSAVNISRFWIDKVSVAAEYLPVSSGIVESIILNKDTTRFTGTAIQIILLPNKK